MTTAVGLKDSKTGFAARVTKFGQLVVAPIAYSESITVEMDVIDTAFNFLTPLSGHSVVITDILVSANKDVSNVEPAVIEIYGADEADSLDAAVDIISPRLIRAANLPMTGLNLLIPEGKWINAKTNDNNVLVTLMFYRVPVEKV